MSTDRDAAFHMADVRRKRPTARRAVARGSFYVSEAAFDLLEQRRLPKGDALVMAEIAGISGAKSAAILMPLCHPLPLELVLTRCVLDRQQLAVHVYCEVATTAKTGVEMEALAGANAALLTLYDLTKPVEPALSIGAIRLLFKEGGKKGLWVHPDGMSDQELARYKPKADTRLDGYRAAIITLSDRASRGEYEDKSGQYLQSALQRLGAQLTSYTVLADDAGLLESQLRQCLQQAPDLIVCTGGTGLGPRDITSDVLSALRGKDVPGMAELFRAESQHFTVLASMSRARAVVCDGTLILALPGSEKAVTQAMDILLPLIAHAKPMLAGGGH